MLITSLANMSSEEELNELKKLRGHGLSIYTAATTSDAYLFSLLGQWDEICRKDHSD